MNGDDNKKRPLMYYYVMFAIRIGILLQKYKRILIFLVFSIPFISYLTQFIPYSQ